MSARAIREMIKKMKRSYKKGDQKKKEEQIRKIQELKEAEQLLETQLNTLDTDR